MTFWNDLSLATSFLSITVSTSLSSSKELPPIAQELAPFVRESLQYLRGKYDWWLNLSTILVVVGVICELPEIVHDLRELFSRKHFQPPEMPSRNPDIRLEKIVVILGLFGWLLVVGGVAGEFFWESKLSTANEEIQSVSDDLLRTTQIEVGNARDAAKRASEYAQQAQSLSSYAAQDAVQAKTDAGNAKILASGARAEADALTGEITSAKQQAADAVSKLADAEKRVEEATEGEAKAEAELQAIRTPRTLSDVNDFVGELKRYPGTEYTFALVAPDAEPIALLRQIDDALQLAGWKRVKFDPQPFMGFPIFGKDDMIPIGTAIGVEVAVESTASSDSLNAIPRGYWPPQVTKAAALIKFMNLHIAPSGNNVNKQVVVTSGSSAVIRISIGKKP